MKTIFKKRTIKIIFNKCDSERPAYEKIFHKIILSIYLKLFSIPHQDLIR